LDGETQFERRLDVDGNSVARRVHGNVNGPGTFIDIVGRRVTESGYYKYRLSRFEGRQSSIIRAIFGEVVYKWIFGPFYLLPSGFEFDVPLGAAPFVNPLYGPITRLDCQPVDGETQDGLVKQFTVCPIIGGEIDKDVKTVSFGDGDSKPKTVITIDKLVIKEVNCYADVKHVFESAPVGWKNYRLLRYKRHRIDPVKTIESPSAESDKADALFDAVGGVVPRPMIWNHQR